MASDRLDERSFAPWLVAAVGLAAIVLLIVTDQVRQHTTQRDGEILRHLGRIEADTAIAHLWLEEYVTGDAVDLKEISARLGDARRRADLLPPFDLPAEQKHVTRLRALLADFSLALEDRRHGFEKNLPVGIGSALDVEVDDLFTRILTEVGALEDLLRRRLDSHEIRWRRMLSGFVVALVLLISAGSSELWRRENARRQAEAELRVGREQVAQSQKLDAVGRLAGGLAHDINNYLAAIRGQSELVRKKAATLEPERIEQKMEAVIRTVAKASDLLERLLTFSRRRETRPVRTQLNELAREIEEMMRPALGKTIDLRTELAGDLWEVEVDPGQFEQLLVNLLVNARDAMLEGGEIVIETRNRGEEVVLAVSDEGEGIAEDQIQHIFEPFWTTRNAVAGGGGGGGGGGGNGLGLAVVYGVVQQHGGRIEVESTLGRGTRFEIFLPRVVMLRSS